MLFLPFFIIIFTKFGQNKLLLMNVSLTIYAHPHRENGTSLTFMNQIVRRDHRGTYGHGEHVNKAKARKKTFHSLETISEKIKQINVLTPSL